MWKSLVWPREAPECWQLWGDICEVSECKQESWMLKRFQMGTRTTGNSTTGHMHCKSQDRGVGCPSQYRAPHKTSCLLHFSFAWIQPFLDTLQAYLLEWE